MQANYTLRADTTRVAQGSGKRINIKLELNKIYTLSVSKPGFQTKDIHFSTFANYGDDFEFSFLVLLVECQIKNTVYTRKNYRLAGQVFYDLAKKDFDYFTLKI